MEKSPLTKRERETYTQCTSRMPKRQGSGRCQKPRRPFWNTFIFLGCVRLLVAWNQSNVDKRRTINSRSIPRPVRSRTWNAQIPLWRTLYLIHFFRAHQESLKGSDVTNLLVHVVPLAGTSDRLLPKRPEVANPAANIFVQV